jgi:hypothetical protein
MFSSIVGVGCFFSVLSVLLTICGTIVDGVFFGLTNSLKFCANTDTGETWGDASTIPFGATCDTSRLCACFNDSKDTCYGFDLTKGDDCGQLLNKVPALLAASMVFCIILFIASLAYSIFTCAATCCNKPPASSSSSSSPAQV